MSSIQVVFEWGDDARKGTCPQARAGPEIWSEVQTRPLPLLTRHHKFHAFYSFIQLSYVHQHQDRIWYDNVAYYKDNSSSRYSIKLCESLRMRVHTSASTCICFGAMVQQRPWSLFITPRQPMGARVRWSLASRCICIACYLHIDFWCVFSGQWAVLSILQNYLYFSFAIYRNVKLIDNSYTLRFKQVLPQKGLI